MTWPRSTSGPVERDGRGARRRISALETPRPVLVRVRRRRAAAGGRQGRPPAEGDRRVHLLLGDEAHRARARPRPHQSPDLAEPNTEDGHRRISIRRTQALAARLTIAPMTPARTK